MKHLLLAVALSTGLAATAPAWAASSKNTPTEGVDGPVLVLRETTYDAESVTKGDVIVAEFVVRNGGTADLKILSVKPACGCTTEEFDSVIPPGDTGRIVLRVATGRLGAGPLTKSAGVVTNDPKRPKLRLVVEAEVTTLIDVLPSDTVSLRRYVGQKKSQTLLIQAKTEKPLAISDIEVSHDAVRHRLTARNPTPDGLARAWDLEVWLDEETPPGNVNASVKLLTTSPRAPVVPIKVRGTVLGQLEASPQSVYFRVDAESTAQQVLTVTHRNAAEFQLMSSTLQAARIDAKTIAIDTEVIRAGSSYRVTVTYVGGLEPGNYTGKIVMGTSDADEPTVEVPLYVIVT